MRLGLALPGINVDSSPLTGPGFVDQVQRVERLGFESLWAFDHINRGFLSLDPLTAVAAAAAWGLRAAAGDPGYRRSRCSCG